MKRSDLLKRILKSTSPNKVDFSALDNEVEALKKNLEETVNIQTVDDVSNKLKQFQKKIDLSPILREVKSIGEQFFSKGKELQEQIDSKEKELESIKKLVVTNDVVGKDREKGLRGELKTLRESLSQLEVIQGGDFKTLLENIESVREIEDRVNKKIEELGVDKKFSKEEAKKVIKELNELIDELRRDLLNKIANLGGGSMNRQVLFGGVDRLTRYTDYNLIAGTNVTFTVSEDNTNKRVNLTISSSGSGGGGITRLITSVAVDTGAGSDADTDYVYLVSGTTTITLPTAVGNENLYTIKNVGVGVVTVVPTGAEVIDDDASVIMPTQYTSVDIISNNVSWNIT